MDNVDNASITIDPVLNARNSLEANEVTNDTAIPSPISPINSPRKTKPKEEIKLFFCAKNQPKAIKRSEGYFPNSHYIGVDSSNKNHFIFSICPDPSETPNLECIKEYKNILNKNANLIKFRVISEQKDYFPDQPNHCKECGVSNCK